MRKTEIQRELSNFPSVIQLLSNKAREGTDTEFWFQGHPLTLQGSLRDCMYQAVCTHQADYLPTPAGQILPWKKEEADTPSFLLQGQVLYQRLNLQMERQDGDVIMNWGVKELKAGL